MEGLCRRSMVYFAVQLLIILIVVSASIVNLSLHDDNREIWISLLSTCLGLMFPNPKLKLIKIE